MKKLKRLPKFDWRPARGLLLAILVLPCRVSTSVVSPLGMSNQFEAIPLGRIRVTKYTHHETGSRVTSSGYVLTDKDENHVCAISRDWWRKSIKPGDMVWIEGQAEPCIARDTMALRNRKGLRQLHWVDIYITDRQVGLDFGIQHRTAYLVRAKAG